jgi:hypothetical protein
VSLLALVTGRSGLAVLADLAGLAAQPADLVAIAAALAAAVLAMALAGRLVLTPHGSAGRSLHAPSAALRERVRRRTVPRQCDPDARGRRRPRAPSPYPSAA